MVDNPAIGVSHLWNPSDNYISVMDYIPMSLIIYYLYWIRVVRELLNSIEIPSKYIQLTKITNHILDVPNSDWLVDY